MSKRFCLCMCVCFLLSVMLEWCSSVVTLDIISWQEIDFFSFFSFLFFLLFSSSFLLCMIYNCFDVARGAILTPGSLSFGKSLMFSNGQQRVWQGWTSVGMDILVGTFDGDRSVSVFPASTEFESRYSCSGNVPTHISRSKRKDDIACGLNKYRFFIKKKEERKKDCDTFLIAIIWICFFCIQIQTRTHRHEHT